MKKYLLQIGLALTLSLSVLIGTLYWYHSVSQSSNQGNTIDIVADVNQITNDVERKPVNSLIWKSIDRSDHIYDGEALRTLPDSQVKIYFRETNSYLDLEPESLIVIRKSKGEISLDLMEGNILVAKDTTGSVTEDLTKPENKLKSTTSLVLNSKKGKIDLSQATASLSKSKGEELSLQVIKGNASVIDNSGKEKQINQGSSGTLSDQDTFKEKKFTILSPDLNKKYFTIDQKQITIPFKWNGFSVDADVELWIGSSNKNLKFYKKTQNVNSEGSVDVELQSGKYFWKLVAKEKSNKKTIGQSPINKTEIELKIPPRVAGPPPDKKWIVQKYPGYALFSVANDGINFQRINLLFANDPEFKTNVSTHPLGIDQELKISLPQKGKYYWKYLTYFEEIDDPITSSIFSFEALTKSEDIIPIQLSWDLLESQNQQYYVSEPKLDLKWKTSQSSKDVKFWRVKYKPFDADEKSINTQDIEPQKLSIETKIQKPGRYLASIEAIDSENRVLGSTSEKEITLKELPLLNTPTFLEKEQVIKTKANGEVDVKWTEISGAKEYLIQILKNGKELKKQ
ncbi:MAG TPA: hypothetical protein PLJ21_09530, partial [Pseudobdellovibrionaceae bacterium]|nr:hypothetical protein [Pseudobdellovibrionaceae bacterium]